MAPKGVGSTPNLNANMFMNMTGTQFVHIPYRGETLVVNDMLGGHVDLFFGNISPVLPHYRDGKFKILAVADTARAPAIPDVPTTAEAGLPGFLSTAWFAAVGPPKLPDALAQRIAADFIEVAEDARRRGALPRHRHRAGRQPAGADRRVHSRGDRALARGDRAEQHPGRVRRVEQVDLRLYAIVDPEHTGGHDLVELTRAVAARRRDAGAAARQGHRARPT